MDNIKLRQSKLGELRWVSAVSLPDSCARSARIASGINALCGSNMYRINELVRVAKEWQQAAAPKYASPYHPGETLGGVTGRNRTCAIWGRQCGVVLCH